MLIDHLVYAAPDLLTAVTDIEERLGVRAQAGGKHIGLGTHNALVSLGPRTYLEIIAPDPDQQEPPLPRPFGIDGVTHGGLVGWAVACADIDGRVAEARKHGYDPGDVIDGQRVGPTGTVLRWRLTLNALAGGVVPLLISWRDTEHPARSAPHGVILDSFELEDPDPPFIAPLLTALGVNVEVKLATAPALLARLTGPKGNTVLR